MHVYIEQLMASVITMDTNFGISIYTHAYTLNRAHSGDVTSRFIIYIYTFIEYNLNVVEIQLLYLVSIHMHINSIIAYIVETIF